MTILEKVKKNAIKYPDRIAVVEQLDEKENRLTWRELDVYSDYLASYFCETLKTRTPIVVYGHKNPYMVVCFLACVKSGRAYCPVDVNVPLQRVKDIIAEVNPEIILSTEALDIDDKRLYSFQKISTISREFDCKNVILNYVQSDEVFYIIFTSGSTGVPKGVQITRDCLDNFINWAVTLGNGCCEDKHYVFINQAPFSFDLSVMDLYLCLYTGGTLWCLNKNIQSNSKRLYESLQKSKGNVWVSTPSFADVCLTDPLFCQNLMPYLTDFLFCGEVLTNRTVSRLMERFPNAKIVNTYGPTESTCAITSVVITEEMNANKSPLPVGIPKKGTWVEIIDENGKCVEEGEHGEIVIVGDSVSIGYRNNVERNKKCFGVTKINNQSYRYYKTGDEGYMINGMLHYCGRIDLQIKLHGYRIELEDIESNLLKIDGIIQAVVVPKYRDGKVSSLVAGVVSSDAVFDESEEGKRIKEKLKENIPEYMIPKKIKFLSTIPRTNNGKIDRKTIGGLL